MFRVFFSDACVYVLVCLCWVAVLGECGGYVCFFSVFFYLFHYISNFLSPFVFLFCVDPNIDWLICLPIYHLLTYLSTYLPTNLSIYLPTYLSVFLPTYLLTCLFFLPSYLLTYHYQLYIFTYLLTYLPYPLTYLPTYLPYPPHKHECETTTLLLKLEIFCRVNKGS